MKDASKFRVAVISGVLLCVLAVAYNFAGEYVLHDVQDYLKRRIYFERVISKKGLSMHEAQYWRKVEE